MDYISTNYEKNKAFLLCIDSDGCVFDTMEIKWKECFIPALIKHFKLQPIAKQVREKAEQINLYSKFRGVNRFVGIPILFDLLEDLEDLERYAFVLPDITDLRSWIATGQRPSELTLEEKVDQTKSKALAQALEWSREVNRNIEQMVVGIPPYPLARETIAKLKTFCDIAVVSSANVEALESEWDQHGLSAYTDIICGQQMGTKSECINKLKNFGYEKDHILMVGDALGDLNAAKDHDVLFYPIVPGDEVTSWKKLNERVSRLFIDKKYRGKEEDVYINEFEKILKDI